ncbi:hypothetical protein AVEN_219386-1 [Araneus ventricosus]|uniref:Uncharacterized protein n=1 Tax=Araneus ventricosus TaxID=182803 RepID=A0A4Y2BH57_ARAVE|nr:hypothetical protein AVEN_219386-1 [Araneus ventricosus]
MSSVKNIDVRADSNAKQGSRIAHPVFAKSATKDEIMSLECRSRNLGQSKRIISSTLPLSSRGCGNVGNAGHFQVTHTNSDNCRPYNQKHSSRILDSCSVSNDSQRLEENREITVFTGSTSGLDEQSSSTTTKGGFFHY